MPERKSRYNESLIQWVWEEQQYSPNNLETDEGERLLIEDPGLPNPGAGPDFLRARVKAGSMLWHGDIEIHNNEEEWFAHKHHTNSNFNRVVLHVFLNRGSRPARTEDQFTPLSLNLRNYLEKPLFRLLLNKQQDGGLPCTGNISPISPEVFEKQLKQAHREYFEYKIDQLLRNYTSGQIMSKAWFTALVGTLYETLGGAFNKSAMRALAFSLLAREPGEENPEEFITMALKKADYRNNPEWKNSGMRPASRPAVRIRQASALHFTIINTPLESVIRKGASIWDDWVNLTNPANLPGTQMQSIVFATVFLPALYLLGDLLHAKNMKEESMNLWRTFGTSLPDEIIKPFDQAGLPYKSYSRKLGLVHQLKRYCRMRNCHRCELFKKSFHS